METKFPSPGPGFDPERPSAPPQLACPPGLGPQAAYVLSPLVSQAASNFTTSPPKCWLPPAAGRHMESTVALAARAIDGPHCCCTASLIDEGRVHWVATTSLSTRSLECRHSTGPLPLASANIPGHYFPCLISTIPGWTCDSARCGRRQPNPAEGAGPSDAPVVSSSLNTPCGDVGGRIPSSSSGDPADPRLSSSVLSGAARCGGGDGGRSRPSTPPTLDTPTAPRGRPTSGANKSRTLRSGARVKDSCLLGAT